MKGIFAETDLSCSRQRGYPGTNVNQLVLVLRLKDRAGKGQYISAERLNTP